ncbi:MAG: metallophosphoesterase [Candidatus Promineifilaceae bacterium]|jgi:calcineurin-like phosphoesterase family protein
MKITTNIFLTSDTHFGHDKIWQEWGYREEYFELEIIKAWNETVTQEDTVLHLGDLTITGLEATREWTEQLNGNKYLIRGNHDYKPEAWYQDLGFQPIPDAYKRFGYRDGTFMPILFTHEPVLDLPEGWFNIHGHLHGDMHRGIETTDHHFDVGVDVTGYKPVRLSEILDRLKNRTKSR